MSYLDSQLKPKPLTGKDDIEKGAMGLRHLSPALFLELQFIKLHTHKGVDSRKLEAEATPEMVKAFRPLEREEHGTATWTGSATSGSVAVTFDTAFNEVPNVLAMARGSDADVNVTSGTPTATGVTLYWKSSATETSVTIAWLAKAR